MFEYNEQARRDMIRQIEHEKATIQAEEARVDGEFASRIGLLDGRLQRLQSQPDEGDSCLECWVFHDVKSTLEAIPSPGHEDHFRCPKCGNVVIRSK
jgi:hypothetical protein